MIMTEPKDQISSPKKKTNGTDRSSDLLLRLRFWPSLEDCGTGATGIKKGECLPFQKLMTFAMSSCMILLIPFLFKVGLGRYIQHNASELQKLFVLAMLMEFGRVVYCFHDTEKEKKKAYIRETVSLHIASAIVFFWAYMALRFLGSILEILLVKAILEFNVFGPLFLCDILMKKWYTGKKTSWQFGAALAGSTGFVAAWVLLISWRVF